MLCLFLRTLDVDTLEILHRKIILWLDAIKECAAVVSIKFEPVFVDIQQGVRFEDHYLANDKDYQQEN